MTELTNREFDRVLAIFRSFSRPSDLQAQIRAEEQPEARKDACISQAYEVLDELEFYGKTFEGQDAKERYLNGTAWNVLKKPVEKLNDQEAAKLLFVLRRHLWREQKKARAAEKNACAESQQDRPF